MRRRLTEITLVILSILIGALTNVATGVLPDMLPADWKQYLWLSWVPLGVIVLLVVVLEWRASRDEPAIAIGETIQDDKVSGDKVGGDKLAGDKLDAQGAQGVINRPSGPVAQTNVNNSGGGSADTGVPRVQSNVAVGDNTGTVIGTNIGTQIINQTKSSTALHQLRAPVGDFVGRTAEIDQLVQALTRGSGAAIGGVRGMGGIGKTELAYAAAQQLLSQFPDAQLLVELSGASSNPLTSEQALQMVIRSFDQETELSNDLSQLQLLYRSVLTGKRALILADDAKDGAQVRPLLPPPGSALLVTSRNRFPLPGMATLDLPMLPKELSETFLLEICPRIGQHARQLAVLCGHLPLALRVSASLLKENDSRDVVRYLGQLQTERLKYLSDPDNPDDPQASVEASLRLSYDALEPAAQSALCQMSVFPVRFDLAMTQAAIVVERDVDEVLELLRRRSLLEWEATEKVYYEHDLVKAFGAKLLHNANMVRSRILRYALTKDQLVLVAFERYKQAIFISKASVNSFENREVQDWNIEWAIKTREFVDIEGEIYKFIRDFLFEVFSKFGEDYLEELKGVGDFTNSLGNTWPLLRVMVRSRYPQENFLEHFREDIEIVVELTSRILALLLWKAGYSMQLAELKRVLNDYRYTTSHLDIREGSLTFESKILSSARYSNEWWGVFDD